MASKSGSLESIFTSQPITVHISEGASKWTKQEMSHGVSPGCILRQGIKHLIHRHRPFPFPALNDFLPTHGILPQGSVCAQCTRDAAALIKFWDIPYSPYLSRHPARIPRAFLKSSMCSASFNHLLTPEGCGRGKRNIPSRSSKVPMISSNRALPKKASMAIVPTSSTTLGRKSCNSASRYGLQRATSWGEGLRSPFPRGLRPGSQRVSELRYVCSWRYPGGNPACSSHFCKTRPPGPLNGRSLAIER